MKFTGARVAFNGEHPRLDLSVKRGRVHELNSGAKDAFEIDLSDHVILPGLINAHDHLEFNLFPRLGKGPHPSYVEWAAEVYRPDSPILKQVLSIPKVIRILWGGLKNLLSGVTTVSHHNPFERDLFGADFPVRVVRSFGWAHSVHFSPDFAVRYAKTPRRWPFLIHVGEGTNAASRTEVCALDGAGVLTNRTVLIHGVAFDARAAKLLLDRGASLVWCPSSNLFTLGETVAPEVLRSNVDIALGTDSALTGEGDLIDELRVARSLNAPNLFAMVGSTAARILRLTGGEGTIAEGGVADLLVVKDEGDILPELMVLGGRIKLISRAMVERIPAQRKAGFEWINLEGRGEYLVDARVSQLYNAVAPILGEHFKLAGKRIGI